MQIRITTQYKSHPNSNVGKVVASHRDRQATVRVDQTLRSDQNHRAAAQLLADRLSVKLGAEVDSNDSGTIRQFEAASDV